MIVAGAMPYRNQAIWVRFPMRDRPPAGTWASKWMLFYAGSISTIRGKTDLCAFEVC